MIPVILSIINLIYLFYKQGRKSKLINVVDTLIFVLGPTYSALLFFICEFPDWSKPVIVGGGFSTVHTPISYESMPTFIALCIAAILGYVILRISRDRLPPMPAAICICEILIGIILSVVLLVQIFKNISENLIVFCKPSAVHCQRLRRLNTRKAATFSQGSQNIL